MSKRRQQRERDKIGRRNRKEACQIQKSTCKGIRQIKTKSRETAVVLRDFNVLEQGRDFEPLLTEHDTVESSCLPSRPSDPWADA